MEENIAKALQIVGGVLVALVLMALISAFFSSIGLFPTEQDQAESAEQIAAFNLEYEVYDKKGMYGVDVISCLNKAKSNNDKYVEGNAFLTGNIYGNEFIIDVWVNLKGEPLQESLEIYKFDSLGVQRQDFSSSLINPVMINNGTTKLTMKMAGFNIVSDYYTSFKNDDNVYTRTNKFNNPSTDLIPGNGEKTYNDKDYFSLKENQNLLDLIALSNKSDTGTLDRKVTNTTGKDLTSWSTIIWKTALSDLKKRKFKCDFVGYNTKTGRVNEIYFSEI